MYIDQKISNIIKQKHQTEEILAYVVEELKYGKVFHAVENVPKGESVCIDKSNWN